MTCVRWLANCTMPFPSEVLCSVPEQGQPEPFPECQPQAQNKLRVSVFAAHWSLSVGEDRNHRCSLNFFFAFQFNLSSVQSGYQSFSKLFCLPHGQLRTSKSRSAQVVMLCKQFPRSVSVLRASTLTYCWIVSPSQLCPPTVFQTVLGLGPELPPL